MRMNKVIGILGIGMFALALSSCGSTNDSNNDNKKDESKEIEITDLVGRKMNITPGSYKKVVCIGAGALRLYSYVASSSLLCGVEDIENATLSSRPQMFDSVARPYYIANKAVYETLPSCGVGGPKAQNPEIEKILTCDPDIIISEYEDADIASNIESKTGVPVITLKTGSNGIFDEKFEASIDLLGTIFNENTKADTLIDFVKAEITNIENRVKDIDASKQKKAYICGLGNWGTTNHLQTAQNYKPFEIAKINNVISGLSKDGIQPIEEEKFISLGESMDVMFIDAAAVKNIKPLYQADNTMFDSCKAWTTGEVYLEMAYNAYYTNYEIALMNTWFCAKTMYPELFSDIDMTEKTNQVTKAFLGKELATEIFAYPTSFGGYKKIDTNTFFN